MLFLSTEGVYYSFVLLVKQEETHNYSLGVTVHRNSIKLK